MKIQQKKYSISGGWETLHTHPFDPVLCNLVLVFGSTSLLENPLLYEQIRESYPTADIVLNSTAGEIYDVHVNNDTISLTAVCFEKTEIRTAAVQVSDYKNSREAGKHLAVALEIEDLKNVLVISDGKKVNGSEFVEGLKECLSPEVLITGGLAGDGSRFKRTLVGLNESPVEGRIVAIGFYGSNLLTNYGSVGGWDPFGPERLITRSNENILYELDGKPALDTYKMYLGEYASELPTSCLLFPLTIRKADSDQTLVRSILRINEEEKSLIFAGNMPEGAYARLMKANIDSLVEGASNAALNSISGNNNSTELSILISCVGRKLILNQRIEEEVEVIRFVSGNNTAITGFYSYGEICPSEGSLNCEFHNQTMTITTLSEQ